MKKTLVVCLFGCWWLTACGQKGPLYLPHDQAGRETESRSIEIPSVSSTRESGVRLIKPSVALP